MRRGDIIALVTGLPSAVINVLKRRPHTALFLRLFIDYWSENSIFKLFCKLPNQSQASFCGRTWRECRACILSLLSSSIKMTRGEEAGEALMVGLRSGGRGVQQDNSGMFQGIIKVTMKKERSPVAGDELTAALVAVKAFQVKHRRAGPHHQLGRGYRVAAARADTTVTEHPATRNTQHVRDQIRLDPLWDRVAEDEQSGSQVVDRRARSATRQSIRETTPKASGLTRCPITPLILGLFLTISPAAVHTHTHTHLSVVTDTNAARRCALALVSSLMAVNVCEAVVSRIPVARKAGCLCSN